MKKEEKTIFPIVFLDEIFEDFSFSEGVRIRKISQEERERFFGLKDINYSLSNNPDQAFFDIKKTTSTERPGVLDFKEHFLYKGIFDGSSDFFTSNYVVEFDNANDDYQTVKNINASFKLFQPTSTRMMIGFTAKNEMLFPTGDFRGPFLSYLSIKNKKNLEIIKRIYKLVEEKSKKDEHFCTVLNVYDEALTEARLKPEVRFTLLVIVLEALYLSDGEPELCYRLSLRISKVLTKKMASAYSDIVELNALVKSIYDVRCQFIHRGKSKKYNTSLLHSAISLVNDSMRIYLEDSDLFKDLDTLCLKG